MSMYEQWWKKEKDGFHKIAFKKRASIYDVLDLFCVMFQKLFDKSSTSAIRSWCDHGFSHPYIQVFDTHVILFLRAPKKMYGNIWTYICPTKRMHPCFDSMHFFHVPARSSKYICLLVMVTHLCGGFKYSVTLRETIPNLISKFLKMDGFLFQVKICHNFTCPFSHNHSSVENPPYSN